MIAHETLWYELIRMWHLTHSCARHDSMIANETLRYELTREWDMTQMCETWSVHLWDITQKLHARLYQINCERLKSDALCMCCMSRLYMCHAVFICATYDSRSPHSNETYEFVQIYCPQKYHHVSVHRIQHHTPWYVVCAWAICSVFCIRIALWYARSFVVQNMHAIILFPFPKQ